MADSTDTPAAAPTPRRRAPRKTTAGAATKTPKARAAAPKADTKAAAPKRTAAPKKAATKPATASKVGAKTRTKAGKAAEKVGATWGKAAVVGGVVAVGAAATAALLSLRGSSEKTGAHTPDGTDASKSFKAGIADENTIPDKV